MYAGSGACDGRVATERADHRRSQVTTQPSTARIEESAVVAGACGIAGNAHDAHERGFGLFHHVLDLVQTDKGS